MSKEPTTLRQLAANHWVYLKPSRILQDAVTGHIDGHILSELTRLDINFKKVLEFADIFENAMRI